MLREEHECFEGFLWFKTRHTLCAAIAGYFTPTSRGSLGEEEEENGGKQQAAALLAAQGSKEEVLLLLLLLLLPPMPGSRSRIAKFGMASGFCAWRMREPLSYVE